jgi:hypothetical protein
MLMQNEGSCKGCLENERIGLMEIKHYILSQTYGCMFQNLVFEFIHTPAIFYRHKIKLTPEQYGLKRWSRSLTRG